MGQSARAWREPGGALAELTLCSRNEHKRRELEAALPGWTIRLLEAGDFPPETGGECELSTSWDTNPGVDLTAQFTAGGMINFLIRVSVAGGGEGYARIRILYDPVMISDTPECMTP